MARSIALGLAAVVLAAGGLVGAGSPDAAPTPAEATDPSFVLGYTMNRIDGTPEHLAAHAGKVILIVNTASKCGLTPQYEGLEALYRAHKDDGLVILGFPANDFGAQEPGTNAEIAEFCTSRFEVSFPMFEKIQVTGDEAHPLFKQLAERTTEMQGEDGGAPTWNFTKYLVDRQGRVVRRFGPRTAPQSPELGEELERLLAR